MAGNENNDRGDTGPARSVSTFPSNINPLIWLRNEPGLHKRAKPMSERQLAKEKEQEKEASMRVGVEDFLARESKHEGRKEKLSKKGPESRKKNRKSSKQGIKSKSKGNHLVKKKKAKKPRPGQAGYLNDFASLTTSNIYEDANRNMDRPDLALVTHTNKEKALKAFLAGVPIDDRDSARGEKTNILKATKTLGNVRADGNGKWKLKGMKCSLLHHQIQGAAWMRERETQDVQPLGGLQADAMGLGKTVMTIAAMISNPPTLGDSKA